MQIETERLIIKTNLTVNDGKLVIPDHKGSILDLKPLEVEDGGFAVYLKSTGELVAHIGLRFDRKPYELTIGTEDGFKGKGYMSEAHTAVVEWLFGNTDAEMICALVGPLTPAACKKILSRDGFLQIDGTDDGQGWWERKHI
jgi:hypothetical protein